jgi:hypothetical protein
MAYRRRAAGASRHLLTSTEPFVPSLAMARLLCLALVVLLSACDSSQKGDRRAFLIAAEEGNVHVVREQLAAGIGPDDVFNINDPTALYLAATNGQEEVVRVLLEAGADPTAEFKGASLKLEVQAFRGRLKDLHSKPDMTSGTYRKQDGTKVDLRSIPLREDAYDRILRLIDEAAKKRQKS